MDLEKLVAEFKAAVRRAGPRGAGRRYPPEARQMAADYFRRRRSAGAAISEISRELGVKRHTLAGWTMAPEAPASSPRFVPVRVVEAPATRLVVHGPGGVRIEGLDLASSGQHRALPALPFFERPIPPSPSP
jgi:transposase-like protein